MGTPERVEHNLCSNYFYTLGPGPGELGAGGKGRGWWGREEEEERGWRVGDEGARLAAGPRAQAETEVRMRSPASPALCEGRRRLTDAVGGKRRRQLGWNDRSSGIW